MERLIMRSEGRIIIFIFVCGALLSMLGYLIIVANSMETRAKVLFAASLLGFTVSKLNK
jgi:hypothetical protein